MASIDGFTGKYQGLSEHTAAERLIQCGPNEIKKEKKKGILRVIFEAATEPMFLLLFAAALIYLLLGEFRDGIVMGVFVLFVTGIEIRQEVKTDKTLSALRELTSPKAKVVRGGQFKVIDASQLTVGDCMIVEEGERVAADAKLIEQYDLTVDESMLTGESLPVVKEVGAPDAGDHFSRGFIYCGTSVIGGRAVAEVTAIGSETEYGGIAKDIMEAPDRPTPLEKQTHKLVRICTLIGIGMLILVFIVTYINTNGNIINSILSGVTLAMGIIPEEFPVILTVFLSMGAWRLAKKNTLIRRLPSVETLGAVSVLCVDKTGTLTQNRMALTEIYTEYNEKDFIQNAVYACEPDDADPMDKAVHERAGELFGALKPYSPAYEYSFTREKMMMGHVTEDGIVAIKGSPESILPLCRIGDEGRVAVEQKIAGMAKKGLRVLALATAKTEDIKASIEDYTYDFAGLMGFSDPPRDGVREAIADCRKAGVRVVMITGDNALTAASIGKKLGIDSARVLSGGDIDGMDDVELGEAITECSIFARVIPAHKMRLVKAFKHNGEIVAMTGDGVNDAPALKYADIGIAMGGRGTQVAREAADMVLLDDNFTTIVETIRDGRRIYDNIRKAITYVLSIHIPIALLALFVPFFGAPLLLLPVHIALMELIIDPSCSILFERQNAEADIMTRPPRRPGEQLITKALVFKSLAQGLVVFACTFVPYIAMVRAGYGEETARAFGFIVLTLSNLLLVNVNVSSTRFTVQNIAASTRDRVMGSVNLLVPLALLALTYLPPIAAAARLAPLSPAQLGEAVGLSVVGTMWWDIARVAIKKKHSRFPQEAGK